MQNAFIQCIFLEYIGKLFFPDSVVKWCLQSLFDTKRFALSMML